MNTEIIYDPNTEAYLLAAILTDPGRIWEVREIVRAADFAVPRNAALYEAMVDTSDAAHLPTAIAVNDQLAKAGRSHEVPFAYPHELTDLPVQGYQAMEFAEIVRNHGERRKLAEVAQKIISIASSGENAGGDINEQAATLIDGLRGESLRQSQPIGAAFTPLVENMQKTIPYTPTPWPSLNAVIGGIRPGGIYTTAGGSGGGKSIFALQLALHVAETGGGVGYVSLEMNREELLKRMISMMTGVKYQAINNHALNEDGWKSFMQAETAVRALPLEVFDRAGAGFEDIVGFARARHRKGGMKLLVVDYHGLIRVQHGFQTKNAELDNYVKRFKHLAQELDIAILLLEQINREGAKRASPRPVVQDIRNTAALEHDASVVILLYRPQRKVGGKLVFGKEIEFIVVKNRHGPQESRTLYFDGAYMRILQAEYENTELLEPGEI